MDNVKETQCEIYLFWKGLKQIVEGSWMWSVLLKYFQGPPPNKSLGLSLAVLWVP